MSIETVQKVVLLDKSTTITSMPSGQGSPCGKKIMTVHFYGLKVCLSYPIIVSVTRSDYCMIPLYYTDRGDLVSHWRAIGKAQMLC